MTIHEYSVQNDYFQIKDIAPDGLCFPCCVCRNNGKSPSEMPCRFCGHNEMAEDFFYCCLCEEIQPGETTNNNFIAIGTPAGIGPICLTCKNTLAGFLGQHIQCGSDSGCYTKKEEL